MVPSLAELLDRLRDCPPSERIELRGPILAFGAAAITPLREAARQHPDLGASVESWLEVLAKTDLETRPAAIDALWELASRAGGTARLAHASLVRLGAVTPPTVRRGAATPAIPNKAGTEWSGFQRHEFGRNPQTSWRSADGKASLAPILTRALRDLDLDFISFGVERSPEIHFALARRYKGSPESGFTSSKLVVYAHGPTDEVPDLPAQVVAGYYIERGDGSEPYGDPGNPIRWDWPLFLGALAQPDIQRELTSVMERHDLRLGDYTGGSRFSPSLGWIARLETGEPTARDVGDRVVARGWSAIGQLLVGAVPDVWVDLHLWRTWPGDVAVTAGQPFALRDIAPVLTDIASIYLRIVQSHR